MNLDGLSLSTLVAELNTQLLGARVDRIFQPDKYTLVFWLRQPGGTLPLLISANPEYPRVHLAENLLENPPVPRTFCMLLRKHLEDGRVAGVVQHSLDRIVTLNIDIRGERGLIVTKQLAIEIMGKHSNIIFSQDGVIIDAIRRIGANTSRVRQVLPGLEYALPPGQDRLNLLTTPADEFVRRLRDNLQGHAVLSKAIIGNAIGLGPLSAREIAWRAGLPADMPPESLDDADAAALSEAITSITTPLTAGEVEPNTVMDLMGNRLIGIAAFRLEHLVSGQIVNYPNMSAAVEFAANFENKPENPEKMLLQKLLSGEINRLKRKEAAITEELATAAEADNLRQNGDILMANLYNIEQGSSEVKLANLYAEDPTEEHVSIALDHQLSALQNAQHYYAKYNKMKRAQESLAIQLSECQAEIAYLDTIVVAADLAVTFDDINELRQELIAAGYIKATGKRRPPPPAAPLTAQTPDGLALIIGKNNRQNDLVTFKQAQPDDLWFHTKDIPGSHVILRCSGLEPSADALTAAASLAAYFSKARQSANVPVDYTRRRYVKKPSGAKPGFVIYDRQKTIYVTPDDETAQKLLGKK